MCRSVVVAALLFATVSAAAQERLGLIVELAGVRRESGTPFTAAEGTTFQPEFDTGGGLGVGLNWHFTDRLSLETKVSALTTRAQLRVVRGDFVGVVDLGRANIYPVMSVVQWHPLANGGTLRPYVGAGVAYVIMQNIAATELSPEISFENPTGFVVNGGLRIALSGQWHLFGDARWVPIETMGGVRFGRDTRAIEMDVRPLVVGFGAVYRF